MLCTAIVQAGAWICLEKYGVYSPEYFYFYYYADSMLTIALFFVIIQLYQWIFTEMSIGRYIRSTASALLVITAIFSFLVIHQNRGQLTTKFVVEFGQNIYFVGVVLTYLLWGAMLKLRETRTRVVQLVLALGIYFSTTAGVYALRNLFPSLEDPGIALVSAPHLNVAATGMDVHVYQGSRRRPAVAKAAPDAGSGGKDLMIAALICVVSIVAFAHFFVSYTRTILISAGGVELSPRVRELVGIADGQLPRRILADCFNSCTSVRKPATTGPESARSAPTTMHCVSLIQASVPSPRAFPRGSNASCSAAPTSRRLRSTGASRIISASTGARSPKACSSELRCIPQFRPRSRSAAALDLGVFGCYHDLRRLSSDDQPSCK